ncbi:MAG: hypothetical protein N2449_10230 [Bacteroidales bacterium]|nr:hypothetical protein [Bacteroidales bacterium]
MQNEKPRILVKTKNLQLVFDYCIETKTEFTVIPRNSNDDWEVELAIRNIIDAVRWGMFLKANKIDLIETPVLLNPTINKPTNTPTLQRTRKEKVQKMQTIEQSFTNSVNETFSDNQQEIEKVKTEVSLDFTEAKTDELF